MSRQSQFLVGNRSTGGAGGADCDGVLWCLRQGDAAATVCECVNARHNRKQSAQILVSRQTANDLVVLTVMSDGKSACRKSCWANGG